MARPKGAKEGIEAKLARVDALLALANPEAAKTMAKGASPAAIDRLRKVLPVPDEALALFAWHDGQSQPLQMHPEDNRVLLSVDEACDAWKFLCDAKEEVRQPWSRSWLPIFSNGAGDYVCIETAKKGAGKLVNYFHDDERRPVAWKNVAAWAVELIAALEKVGKKKPAAKGTRLVIDAADARWKKAGRRPKEKQLESLAPGAVVWWPKMIDIGTPGVRLHLKIEKGDRPWRFASGSDPAAALVKLQEYLDSPKPPDDGNWKSDSFDLAFNAEEDRYDDASDDPLPVEVHEGTVKLVPSSK